MYLALAVLLLFVSRVLEGRNIIINTVVDTVLLFIFFTFAEIRDRFFTLLFKRG